MVKLSILASRCKTRTNFLSASKMPRLIVPSAGGGTKLIRTLRVGEGAGVSSGVGEGDGEGEAVGDSCATATVTKINAANMGDRQSAISIWIRCNTASLHSEKDCHATRNRQEIFHRERSRRTDRANDLSEEEVLGVALWRIPGPFRF